MSGRGRAAAAPRRAHRLTDDSLRPLAAARLAAWGAAAAEAEAKDEARTPPEFALSLFAPAWRAALELLDAALEQFT